MPHFGRSPEVSSCVKQFLACFHGGYLWFGTKVHVTIDLISLITSLPKAGVDPSQYLCGKDNDKKLAVRLWKKYGVVKCKQAYVIDTFNDTTVHVGEKFLAVKIM